MNYTYSKEKVRQFKPLILFHNADDNAPHDETSQPHLDDENQRSLIEQHRLKTIDMMRYNAHIWENSGYDRPNSYDTPTSKDNEQQVYFHRPIFRDEIPRRYSHNNTMIAPTTSTLLEPQTQTSIPPPLYHDNYSPKASSSSSKIEPILISEFQHAASTSTKRSLDNEGMIGSTFITEPQFHHIYKPQLNRKRRRGNLPKKVTEFLKQWLILHKKHPYPTEREKQKLADETGLMVSQISNWFINARRRILQPLLESESHQQATSSHHPQREHTPIPHSLFNTPDDGDRILASIDVDSNKQEADYYYYYDSDQPAGSSKTFPLVESSSPSEPTMSNNNKGTAQVPPPWVLLPAKLPSMNILEKDMNAFQPEEE